VFSRQVATSNERITLLVSDPIFTSAHNQPMNAMLFGTGARPSEVIALRWGDVDLRTGIVSISKSRYTDTDSPTKTVASEREISLGEPIVAALRALKPLRVAERDFVFRNQEGNPVTEDKWWRKYWYRALRAVILGHASFTQHGTRSFRTRYRMD
jgi:integrase